MSYEDFVEFEFGLSKDRKILMLSLKKKSLNIYIDYSTITKK